jgi:hypothetical protein
MASQNAGHDARIESLRLSKFHFALSQNKARKKQMKIRAKVLGNCPNTV